MCMRLQHSLRQPTMGLRQVAMAPLTVKAANVSRVIGAANGTVNNDVLTASYTTTATAGSPAGTYPIVAAITGANIANYSVTLTNGTLAVTPATATTTALTTSASPVVVGASVTFTATVTPASGTPTPTGGVTFKDGTTTLGTGTLNATGVATFATTALAVGSHSVTASYAGDTSNVASVSSAVTVVVTAGPPDFSLSLTPTSSSATNGTSEVVTVTVTPSNGFNTATALACSGLSSYSTCSFNPSSVTPSGAAATSTLTIATDVKAAAIAQHLALIESRRTVIPAQRPIAIAGVVASFLLLPLAGWKNRRLRKLLTVSAVVFAAALATASMTGCGGGSTKTPTLRDADAAKRLFRRALSDLSHPQPRVINTDQAPIYSSAISDSKKEGTLRDRCRHRPVQYLNNILEQDHRSIKRRVNAKQGFREFQSARQAIQGYEAIHMIRKGQIRWWQDMICFGRFSSSTTSSIWQPEHMCAHAINLPAFEGCNTAAEGHALSQR
jgi:hypothetical protein